jgi:hypothetical protein
MHALQGCQVHVRMLHPSLCQGGVLTVSDICKGFYIPQTRHHTGVRADCTSYTTKVYYDPGNLTLSMTYLLQCADEVPGSTFEAALPPLQLTRRTTTAELPLTQHATAPARPRQRAGSCAFHHLVHAAHVKTGVPH